MLRTLRTLTLLSSVALLFGCATTAPQSDLERLTRQVVFTVAEDDARVAVTSGFQTLDGERTTPAIEVAINRIVSWHGLRKISRWTIKPLGVEAIVAEIRDDRTIEEVCDALAEDRLVESVQPVRTYNLLTYNDPYFHMQNASVRGSDIERVHELTTGKDVVVAVVDTGVDRRHPELRDRIILSRNFVEHDGGHFDTDEHGTSVAGIIGSAANNDLGIVGVAPDVKLMAFKSCWENVGGRQAQCDSYSLMKALVEVLKVQPDILNLSLSGPPDPLIARLLDVAIDRGVIVVAAVSPEASASFPASMPRVLAVGTPVFLESMPAKGVLAPGIDVLTTTPGATYAFRSGSSIATAYVSGVAALLKERRPSLSTEQLRARLVASAKDSINLVPVIDICSAVLGEDGDAGCAEGSVAD